MLKKANKHYPVLNNGRVLPTAKDWNEIIEILANIGNGELLVVDSSNSTLTVDLTLLPTYADDTAAGTGGLTAGNLYKTATGDLKVKL